MWPVLVHEMAHAVEKDRQIANKVLSDALERSQLTILESWTKELIADQIALRLVGPAYFGSIIDLSIAGGPTEWVPSHTHPQPGPRFSLMLRSLDSRGLASDSAKQAKLIFDQLTSEDRITEASNPYAVPPPAIALDDLWQRIGDFLEREPWFQKLQPYDHQAASTIGRLTRLLGLSQPISAYRRSDDADILAALEEFRILKRSPTREQVYQLLERVEESPTTVSQILNAGWEHRLRSKLTVFSEAFSAEGDQFERYLDRLTRMDYLLRKSLESAKLHAVLNERIDPNAT
jgi:hypothetical protein